MKSKKWAASILAATGILTASGIAYANIPPGPDVVDLTATQEGQDVSLTIGVHCFAPCSGRIVRTDVSTSAQIAIYPDGDVTPNDGILFPTVRTEQTLECDGYLAYMAKGLTDAAAQTAYCESSPEECTDCDGDGIADCAAGCFSVRYMLATDTCVPPGAYTYLADFDNTTGGFGGNDPRIEVEVVDNGYAACFVPEIDTDTGQGESEDSDEAPTELETGTAGDDAEGVSADTVTPAAGYKDTSCSSTSIGRPQAARHLLNLLVLSMPSLASLLG